MGNSSLAHRAVSEFMYEKIYINTACEQLCVMYRFPTKNPVLQYISLYPNSFNPVPYLIVC